VPRLLTLDVETVPDESLVSAVDGEPHRPYGEQLDRLLSARRAQSGGRSDFLPLPYHRPVAACTLEAKDDGDALALAALDCWTDRDGDEASFLARTWKRVRGKTLVTFHGRGFDLPVLELRSLKLGVPAPGWFSHGRCASPDEHQDLYDLFSNDGAAPAAPLDLYAKLVGLPGKEDVAGKDVRGLYAAGALERIAAYCTTDVVQTWLLYLRFRLLQGTLAAAAYQRSVERVREELPALFARRFGAEERALLDAFLARCAPFFDESAPAAPLRRAL
jgi:predicted PolB exonuclease-like 3'-5' exonuclease